MIRLVLIEDDEKIRDYFEALIGGIGEFKMEAAFASAEEAMSFFKEGMREIELVVTDIELTGLSGIDFISWLKPKFPNIQIMILSSYEDTDRIFRALKAGASGYILKNTPAAKLIDAIYDLHRGGSPMSSQIARLVVSAFQQETAIVNPQGNLSFREKDVLHWLSQGYRYQEIADKLFISLETVRTHIRNIYEKLQAHNRNEALRKVGLL
ncbi:response regulator transcription factor [soil metagenome]